MTELQVTDAMADAAITWFARLRADDVSDSDRNGFVGWLKEDRRHQLAFVEILNLWDGLSVVKTLDFEELRSFAGIWNEREKLRSMQVDLAG